MSTQPTQPPQSIESQSIAFKGKDKRNKKRQDGHRDKKSTELDTTNKKVIYDQLYFGFKNLSDAMISMQVTTSLINIILPISTRAAGFITRYLVSKFARLGIRNIDYHHFCSSLYRLTLLSIDVKLMCAMNNQVGKNTGRNHFQTIDLNIDYVRVLGEFGAGFAPIKNLINSIGVFRGFGTMYVPRLSNLAAQDQIITWDPTQVSFGTLRQYVVALALQATPRATRRYFYDHSPLPNALWGGNADQRRRDADGEVVPGNFPLLLNPDDIMPAHYTLNELRQDATVVMDIIEQVSRKYEKYVSVGRIDFNVNGAGTQLVSNKVEDIRCSDLLAELNYAIPNTITGTIENFWSSEVLSDPEFYLGIFHLSGELPGISSEQHYIRNVSKQTSAGDYNSCISNLLG